MATLQEIRQQIALLEQQAEDLLKIEKAAVIEEMLAKITEYDITPQELGFYKISAGDKNKKSRVLYRSELGETWAGRGRKPAWLVARLAAGEDIEQYRVK